MGSGQYYPKAHETILCYKSKNAFFRAPARLGLPTRITGALQKDDSGWFYTRGKESSGGETFLKTYISKNPSFSKEEAIFEANIERPQPAWDVWIGKDKLAKAYNDHPVGTYAYTKTGNVGYPTQKPESLLARIIHASSQDDDIILDAFAGSGTTLTVAEKLGRRWIGIDCGKLAIYTMQKRLMNLKKEIGQKGQTLKAKPFTLYNAGLYDFKRMSELPWEDYRLFALQLFQVRDKKHALAGIELDGFKNDADVLVFNFKQDGGIVVDEEYVAELNRHFGSRTRDEFYIIAPASRVTFLEDYIDHGPTRYYILRIPYSIIDELHNRPFEQIRQPVDETEINNTVEAVGFDFIIPPTVKAHYSLEKPKGELYDVVTITIEKFTSEVMTKKPRKFENRETLSMVMVDYSYAGNGNGIFDLDAVFYRGDIEKDKWKVRLDAMQFGERIMIIYMDIFGNELREVKTPLDFGIKANRVREDTAPYGKSKRTTKKSKTAKVKKKAASNIPTKKKAVKSKRKTAKKAAQRRSNR
jgi:site-specific DNA-methyltransferase (adenine-specific)/adenine-specific DNA-methyltransferase